ncbi:DUF3019 domain-containing protein [Colwellia psychrerythraea]|uniref:DUF3019 domain-containing protein n=1 Tax=Colwellia psychrerythraea TaxID=28229 RepID=A0A099KWK3_COLPS|nr:DUF3019 domain-containing protein [Colwellia psychrerythraea]KGJ94971.1 Protein of unknown function DUF3019 [Colwellia psychrerythraea]
MYFKVGKGFATVHVKVMLILFYNLLVLNPVYANESKALSSVPLNFTALPEQCVTLRQGRACFATVELQWQSPKKESFCLYQVGKNKQLGCWQNNNNVQIKIEFESNKSIKYQLRSVSDNKVIAETQVEVSWQHKNTSRKRRWRLF